MKNQNNPTQTTNSRGHLVLIGGSEDRRGPMRILRSVAALNNAQTIAVIPTATNYPNRTLSDYHRAFSRIGVPEVISFDIRTPDQAGLESYREEAMRADAFFFTGGDQVKLTQAFNGTPLLETIRRRFHEGATIAGTSAGAAAAGNPMIFDGDGRGFRKGFVNVGRGFGFLDALVVDTHFIRRGRIARLAQFLCSGLCKRGIGLAEDTGIIVNPSGIGEVIGRDMVTTLDASPLQMTNYHQSLEEMPLTMDGLRLGFLAPGTIFDIDSLHALATPEERMNTQQAAGAEGMT